MASNDSGRSDASSSSGEEDYGVVRLQGFAPYQDEPLAIAGQPTFHFEEDKDGIPHAVLAARQEQLIIVEDWYFIPNYFISRGVLFLFFKIKTVLVSLGPFRTGSVGKVCHEVETEITVLHRHIKYFIVVFNTGVPVESVKRIVCLVP